MMISGAVALGTVQLGLPYGIANTQGKPSIEQAEQIVARAWSLGVRWFDTAQAYGDSESVLGHCLKCLGKTAEANVVSKLNATMNIQSRQDLRRAVLDSLQHLQLPSLAGFLLHREEMLDAWSGVLCDTLLELRSEGLIKALGVSVYSAERALQAIETTGIDMLQVPANVFDRRMARAGIFELAEEKGKMIFVRSVFLQGLVLMDGNGLPDNMSFARNAVATFTNFCEERNLARQHFALAYTKQKAINATLVVGAETANQVEENCFLAGEPISQAYTHEWDRIWPEDSDTLVNPSKWPAKR